MFTLSKRSLDRLVGVDSRLVSVVERAIQLTTVDFGVTEGLRSKETQERYVKAGKSQGMASKHLTGHAVDLVAYMDGQVSWELNLYDDIADAMKAAAIEYNLPIRWGAAWNVPDIRKWEGTMASAMLYYIDERRRENRRPFIDGPHFEIS
jgi:peptidoglycan L-alanyl-D-glutamate endopeptidase CwlK